jgi:hypothetical protein
VTKWRKALDVAATNEGTRRLRQDLFDEILPEPDRAEGRKRTNLPEANAKKAAYRKGKPIHPNALAALKARKGRRASEETRRKIGEASRRRGARPPKGERIWTPDELALLGVLPDAEVAQRTQRTFKAVQQRREKLGIRIRRAEVWKAAEDELLRTLPNKLAAKLTGRTIQAAENRRYRLRLPPSPSTLREGDWTPEEDALFRAGAACFKEAGIDDPSDHFQGKTIRVRGVVIRKDGRPYIEVDDPIQIEIVG